MKDKATVRYLGYRALADGGRGFDFSLALIGEEAKLITIEASADLFRGRICYETLRSRIETDPTIPAHSALTRPMWLDTGRQQSLSESGTE